MDIADICQRNVDTAQPGETARAAAQRMATRGVGSLVVVDGEGRPTGIVTDRDLALRVVGAGLDPLETTVGDVMSRHLASIDERGTFEHALAAMRANAVRRLPVVDAAGRLVGIVSLEDVLAVLSRAMTEVGTFLQQTSPARAATS